MQGCEMKCAYCIVPYTRGAERSRPIRDVVAEVKMLADAGVQEVTLLGQIVNRYGRQMETADGKGGFVQLLEAVHEVEAALESSSVWAGLPKRVDNQLNRCVQAAILCVDSRKMTMLWVPICTRLRCLWSRK